MKNLPITLFFLVSALLNTGCKSENTALTTPFSIQMKSSNEFTEGLPENTVESFESYESDCIEYLLYNMIDKKLDIMSFNVKVWKGVIDLNDGNVLNSVLGMGSLISDATLQVAQDGLNTGLFEQRKNNLVQTYSSFDENVQLSLTQGLEIIEKAVALTDATGHLKLFYPKRNQETQLLQKCATSYVPVLAEKNNLVKLLPFVDYYEEIADRNNTFLKEIILMRYFLIRNHEDNYPDFLSAVRLTMESNGQSIQTGNNELDKAIEKLQETINFINNPPAELVSTLKISNEATRKEFEEFQASAVDLLMIYFN